MQKKGLIFAAVSLVLAAAPMFFITSTRYTPAAKKLHVVATTSILADAIRQVGKNLVTVTALMGPGIDPHSYHARLSDLRTLVQADIIIYNGLHLEGKIATILHKLRNTQPTYAAADALNKIDLITSGEFGGIYDPHIWFDVSLWKAVICDIAQQLSTHDPVHKEHYRQHASDYARQLNELEREICDELEHIPTDKRYLITSHDAFSYFGRAYDISVLGLQGINIDAEPSIKDMQQMVQLICQKQIHTIFVESALPHRSMQALEQAALAYGWPVTIGDELYTDALGTADEHADTYIDMMRHNVATIVSGLA